MEDATELYADVNASQIQPAEFGKTELSLMHFTVRSLLSLQSVMWSETVGLRTRPVWDKKMVLVLHAVVLVF